MTETNTQKAKDARRLKRLEEGLAKLDERFGSAQQQQRFVNGYLRFGHFFGGGKKAAIWAGYSEKGAAQVASDLLTKPHIQEAIQAGRDRAADRSEATPEKIIAGLSRIAFADIGDVVTWEDNRVTIRNLCDMEPHETEAIHSVEETRTPRGGSTLSVKMHDKLKALDALARILGIRGDKDDAANVQLGGVLRVKPQPTVQEWEQEQGISEDGAALTDFVRELQEDEP